MPAGGIANSAGDAALAEALRVLADGGVVAVKGLGGYHLACDARDAAAVARLRERKRRSAKPFAVMVRDLAVAGSLVRLAPLAVEALTSPRAPVVLAPVRVGDAVAEALAAACAPGNGRLGVMLPYTVLHHLLLAEHPEVPGVHLDALVLTSGNLADEPLCTRPDEAERRLAGIADAFLHHDRPIHAACDDSVVARRRRRGAARASQPRLRADARDRFPSTRRRCSRSAASSRPRPAWPRATARCSRQHVGDTENLETLDAPRRGAGHGRLAHADRAGGDRRRPAPRLPVEAVGAASTPRRSAPSCVLVQHHHAHLASLLAEHQVPPDEPVLGFASTAPAIGDDGAIWGGELLLGSYDTVERVGHLAEVPLPGGDAAVRGRPARRWRTCTLRACRGTRRWPRCGPRGAPSGRSAPACCAPGAGCTPTTSMGRLFDAVASLAGVCQDATYEAQAAIELEALAEAVHLSGARADLGWRFGLDESGGVLVLDPTPVVRSLVAAVLAGEPAGAVAAAFHEAVASAVVVAALHVRAAHGRVTVGLTGGVFANGVLTRSAARQAGGRGRRGPGPPAGTAQRWRTGARPGGGRRRVASSREELTCA